VNCRLFRRGIQEPAIEEEQKQLQYPQTRPRVPTNAARGAVYPDVSPQCSTAAVTKPLPINFDTAFSKKDELSSHATSTFVAVILLKPISGTENTLSATI
jgi:hypothetical protein